MQHAGSIDDKKQDLNVVQTAKDDCAITPIQNHQFQLPVDCKVEMRRFFIANRTLRLGPWSYVTAPFGKPKTQSQLEFEQVQILVKNSKSIYDMAVSL